ncbi:unnamed protein product [Symbiodinium natans]|uniref:Uncharacterized protein n=1 Tax=Symbiodinium natans TaxID=878477 RepID=A0A812NBN3_9DINO|nr:unnamed protein product [Symbiodinium natans]
MSKDEQVDSTDITRAEERGQTEELRIKKVRKKKDGKTKKQVHDGDSHDELSMPVARQSQASDADVHGTTSVQAGQNCLLGREAFFGGQRAKVRGASGKQKKKVAGGDREQERASDTCQQDSPCNRVRAHFR